jgi:hypothetical protein
MESLVETTGQTVPKEATHTLRVDIVNKDASVKRIEINFCNKDAWSEAWPDALNIAEMFEGCLHNLIVNDKFSIGSKLTIINRATGNPIGVDIHPMITKPEFILGHTKPAA